MLEQIAEITCLQCVIKNSMFYNENLLLNKTEPNKKISARFASYLHIMVGIHYTRTPGILIDGRMDTASVIKA